MTKKRRIALAAIVVCVGLVSIEAYRIEFWPAAKPAAEVKPAARAETAVEARAREYARQLQLQREILAHWRKYDQEGETRSPFYFLWVAGLFKQFAVKHLGSLKDLNIVEIGPGSSMIPAALYASAGAKHLYCVDIFEHPAIRDALPYRTAFDLAKMDADYLVREENEIILKEEGGKATLNPDYITFVNRESFDTGLPNASVDYVFSMATIEHLNDPLRSIAEWKRILKPGGISAHFAGLADHRDFSKPYEYLKLDPAAWRAQFGPGRATPLHEYVNQWRPIDFRRAFEKAGFEILEYSTEVKSAYNREQVRRLYPNQSIGDADWEQIAPAVREGKTREEVSQIFITIVVRKPANSPKRR
jgi:SAM-dependent methyltransferase